MSGNAIWPSSLSVVLGLVLATSGLADDPALPSHSPKPSVARVLRWFPPDTEAFAVANGPLELKRSLHDIEGDQKSKEPLHLPELGTIFACSRLSLLQDGNLFKSFQGLKVDAVVDGRRRFQVDEDSGTGHCDGCQILLVAEEEAPKVDRVLQAWIAAGRSTIRVEAQTAVLVEEKEDDQLFRALFASPAPGVLLCASTPGFLREVLARMRDETMPSAFPADRPEWKVVNCQAPFWGVRRFVPDGRTTDASSPFHKRAAVADPKAIGIAFWCGAGDPNQMEFIYLSQSRNAATLLSTESFDKDEFRIDRIAADTFRIQKIEKPNDDDERLNTLVEILMVSGFLRAI